MAIPIDDLNAIMECNCDGPVNPKDFDISSDRIKVLLVCETCGKMVAVEGPIDVISDVRYDETPRLDNNDDCE